MKLIKADLHELPRVNIHILGDLHIGSNKFMYNEFKCRIDNILSDEYARVIILGDVINNSTKTSIGDCYSEPLSPMEQIKLAKNLLEPIKDKIIGIVAGNHERRSYKTDGLDIAYFLASELGIADKYDYSAGCILVRFGANENVGRRPKCISIYCTHGDGNGGRTVGGKANGLSKRGQIIDADVIVTGHTHTPLVFAEASYHIDVIHNKIIKRDQLFVNCGSALDYEEYAELYGLKPSSERDPVIYLTHTGTTAVV